MQFSAAEIAQMINGKLEGESAISVASFGKIEEAKEGQLSFLANPKYEDFLYTTKASVVIINNALQLKQPVAATLIRVPDAYSAFALLLDKSLQLKTSQLSGIQDPVFMHPTAKIGENVYLGAFVYIGENAIIGNQVKIFPGCFIGNNVSIDENSIIHAGVKIYHDIRKKYDVRLFCKKYGESKLKQIAGNTYWWKNKVKDFSNGIISTN